MKNGFTKKSVGTMTLGEKIGKLRSDKRISLLEASRATKIQVAYLEFLEEGNYEKLPAEVYVKGFLRSYGDFLGVDENILIKLYEKEKGIKRNLEKSKNGDEKVNNQKTVDISSFVFTPKKIIAVVSVGLVLAGFFYLYNEIGSFAGEPRLVVISPENNSSVAENSIVVEGLADKDANLYINDHPILVADDGKFRELLTLQSGVNTINIKSVNKFKKEASQVLTVNSERQMEEENYSVENKAAEENSANEELRLEVRVDPGSVWLAVEADGNLVFSGTMLSGATQSFRAKDKFIVNSGRANATFVMFNGKEVGALGAEANAVRGVVFDRETK